jgi:hypothetical protein
MQDLEGDIPAHLTKVRSHGSAFWTDDGDCWNFHTAAWWKSLLSQRNVVDVELADTLPKGWQIWAQHERAEVMLGASRGLDTEALEADRGRFLGFVRIVMRRR